MQPQDKNKLLSDAYSFLQQQTMGVIATVAPDSTPESAAVNYMIDNDWKIFILTKIDSRKVQNIRQNKHVSFVVGVAQIPHTVQIQADAEIIEEQSEYELLFTKLKDSKRLDRDPMYDIFGHNYVILKLTVTWLRWLSFEEGTGKDVFTVLIP